jgi:heme oxygenase
MVTATPTTDTPFSAAIRRATWDAHGDAEQAPWLSALVAGEVSREGFADLVAQHHFAYEALEAAADVMADDPVAGPFVDPALTRGPALVRDLEALLGPSWRDRVAPSPATAAYVARIDEICRTWPGGFVAHHYTRYLGDLSGGQMLRGTIESVYGIDAACGTAFYDFPLLDDLAAYKAAYRRRLDTAPWDDAERARIIDEVLVGYRHNSAVLEQLRS